VTSAMSGGGLRKCSTTLPPRCTSTSSTSSRGLEQLTSARHKRSAQPLASESLSRRLSTHAHRTHTAHNARRTQRTAETRTSEQSELTALLGDVLVFPALSRVYGAYMSSASEWRRTRKAVLVERATF